MQISAAMRKPSVVVSYCVLLATVICLFAVMAREKKYHSSSVATASQAIPKPSPDLNPRRVVQIQLKALKHNGPEDEGIAAVFEFASPANRAKAGTVEQFKMMVKRPPYRAMLGHVLAQYHPIEIAEGEARQLVELIAASGRRIAFVFVMTKQTESPYNGCWMVDAVYRVPLDRVPPLRSSLGEV